MNILYWRETDMLELKDPIEGYAQVEGARLHYEMAGQGGWLVLVHAGIADRHMWDYQWPVFTQHFRTLRYDMRGYGDSPMSHGPFSNRADLFRLLQFLEIGRAVFIGASMGGMCVLDFALEHPEMVSALVLVGAAVSGFQMQGEPPAQLLELITARKDGDLQRAAELQVQIWGDGPGEPVGRAGLAVRERILQMSLKALANQAEFLHETGFISEEPPGEPAFGRLEQVAVPTLAVAGALDDLNVLRAVEVLVERIPEAEKRILPDAAHLPNTEKPEAFNRGVMGFLRRATNDITPAA
jgi:3-oxoadipate enol-lactonase